MLVRGTAAPLPQQITLSASVTYPGQGTRAAQIAPSILPSCLLLGLLSHSRFRMLLLLLQAAEGEGCDALLEHDTHLVLKKG